MKALSGKELRKIIEKYGWIHHRTSGSHFIYKKEGIKKIVSIPIHKNKELPIGTLKSILKDTGLTEEDLE